MSDLFCVSVSSSEERGDDKQWHLIQHLQWGFFWAVARDLFFTECSKSVFFWLLSLLSLSLLSVSVFLSLLLISLVLTDTESRLNIFATAVTDVSCLKETRLLQCRGAVFKVQCSLLLWMMRHLNQYSLSVSELLSRFLSPIWFLNPVSAVKQFKFDWTFISEFWANRIVHCSLTA